MLRSVSGKILLPSLLCIGALAATPAQAADGGLIGALFGAGLGGALGNQVGQGSGRVVATVAGVGLGALLGNAVGSSYDRPNDGYVQEASYYPAPQPVYYTQPASTTVVYEEYREPRWKKRHRHTHTSTTYVVNEPVVYAAAPAPEPASYCREYQQTVVVGGQRQSSYGTACMQPDGSWQMQ
jgi:surface antigen